MMAKKQSEFETLPNDTKKLCDMMTDVAIEMGQCFAKIEELRQRDCMIRMKLSALCSIQENDGQ